MSQPVSSRPSTGQLSLSAFLASALSGVTASAITVCFISCKTQTDHKITVPC